MNLIKTGIYTLLTGITLTTPIFGDVVTWVAQGSDHFISTPTNWSTGSVPLSTDDAIFDSNMPNIVTNPVENAAAFDVSTFQFPNSAAAFTFNFNEQPLTFTNGGITSSQTNTTINLTNTDNTNFLENQLLFNAGTNTSGSATINIANSATQAGSDAGIIAIDQFSSTNAFTILNGGSITITNEGTDVASGTPHNIGIVGTTQLDFADTLTAGNNVGLSISNTGTLTGSTSTGTNSVGDVDGGHQFHAGGAVQAGDNFNLFISNSGTNDITNTHINYVGSLLNDSQALIEGNLTVGNNSTITMTNDGNSSGSGTVGNMVCYMQNQQLLVDGNLQTGNNFNMTMTNTGNDSTTESGGNVVGNIDGTGVTGQQVNIAGTTSLGSQISITVTNSGTYTGTNTIHGCQVGALASGQIQFAEVFNAGDYFNLDVSTSGIDSSHGYGSDVVGTLSGDQIAFEDSCTLGNYATITANSSGNYSGSNSTVYNTVAGLPGEQFSATNNFQAGNNFTLNVGNSAINSGSGLGNNYISYIGGANQVHFYGTCTLGSNANITVSNNGNSTVDSGGADNVAMLRETGQMMVDGPYIAGNNVAITVTNEGLDASIAGNGNYVGVSLNNSQLAFSSGYAVQDNNTFIVSNSGTSSSATTGSHNIGLVQDQLNFGPYSGAPPTFNAGNNYNVTVTNTGVDTSTGLGANNVGTVSNHSQATYNVLLTTQDNTVINISNSGTNSGNTTNGNTVGLVASNQFHSVYPMSVNDSLNISISNTGICSSTGNGSNFVGEVSSDSQMRCDSLVSIGANAIFTISNSGNNSGSTTSGGNNVGYVENFQMHASGGLTAGDFLQMTLSNIGVDSGNSISNNSVGVIYSHAQIQSEGAFDLGNNATINLTNSGTNSGSSPNNLVGYIGNHQFYCTEAFSAGNSLNLSVSNSGTDSSSGSGDNFTGAIATSSQIEFDTSFSVLDNATIKVSNSGTYSGSTTSSNNVGYVQGQQFYVMGGTSTFSAGNSLSLSVSNTGNNSNTGSGGSNVGVINFSQLQFDNTCSVGDDATITILNSGINSSSITGASIGVVTGSQFLVSGAFLAGNNLTLSAANTALNTGNLNNTIGSIGASQIAFANTCTIGNGTLISADNNGTVADSQILFTEGFDINGQATIQATNQGTVGGYGILVQGSGLGGDANIVLVNSSFYADTSGSTFTIGGLNGDSTSTAQSFAPLIINTDATVNANFAGIISNFPTMSSTLTKTGSGSQTLSGTNTYTGVTTVQQGTLVLTGSVFGDVNVNPAGVLKGTGTVGGNVYNRGTMAPGLSIGTMNILGNFSNDGGNYNLEINGAGQSDLINVSGVATINGGIVYVSSFDGSYVFQTPYTILQATSVSGVYSGTIPLSPLLNPKLSYDATHVYITLTTSIERAAKTHNQFAVAERLDNIVDPTINQTILLGQMVDLSPSDAREALDSLSGYQHTDDFWTTQLVNRQFIRRLYDPIRSIVTRECNACCDPCDYCNTCYSDDWTTWLEGDGGYSHLRGNSNAHGFTMNSYEFSAGAQKTICSDWTLGIGVSYEYDHLHYIHGGSGKNNTCLIGLYGLYRPNDYYGLIDLTYGYSMNTINRAINVGPLHYTARSKPKVSQVSFYGEVGADFNVSCFLIQPFVGLEVEKAWRCSVKEHEAHGWGLSIQEKNWFAARSRLGLHMTMNDFYDITDISLDLAWNQLWSSRKNHIGGKFIRFGNSYDIYGIDLDDSSIDYALTFSSYLIDNLRGYIEFTGESWQKFTKVDVLCGVEYMW